MAYAYTETLIVHLTSLRPISGCEPATTHFSIYTNAFDVHPQVEALVDRMKENWPGSKYNTITW